ncbi:hypothetical protein Patl1_15194 [Pistacia atlantica]|uniref:Uncharacterized protein n=1 Tax=Pistacia atlantica TaxID=434234 RepID=A0ACC1B9F2_9ROSI|nr:hypothetical protein Patl1_15194 [Pistacia atlantica]
MGYNLTWSVECRDCVKDSGECELNLISRSPRTFICINKNEGFVKYMLTLWEHISLALRPFHPDSFSEYLDYSLNSTSQTIFLFLCFVALFSRFILAPTILLLYILHKYRKKYNRTDNVEKFLHNQQSWMPKRYSYAEIMAMTNHFEVHLGKGGSI